MRYGFSTGSIALGDVRRGLEVASHGQTKAVELSALREAELEPLLKLLPGLQRQLEAFEYVSIHAPSKLDQLSEAEFVAMLKPIADRGWAIIIHPDVINDFSLWRSLGKAVCIENMDKRKSTGQTANQLKDIFRQLPDATFCFDIGHARQVDPTMQEADLLLQSFKDRLSNLGGASRDGVRYTVGKYLSRQ